LSALDQVGIDTGVPESLRIVDRELAQLKLRVV
jgi:hypothetical protein